MHEKIAKCALKLLNMQKNLVNMQKKKITSGVVNKFLFKKFFFQSF